MDIIKVISELLELLLLVYIIYFLNKDVASVRDNEDK